jgi:hypothetical protein
MAKDVSTYQSKVGRIQGGGEFYMKDEGLFQWGSVEKTGLEMQNAIAASGAIIGAGATSTVLSITNYSVGLQHVWLSMTSTLVAGSYAMVSGPKQGEQVYIGLKQNSNISGVITILFSGCSFVGIKGSTLESVTMHMSAASAARIHLICFNDDEWTAVDYNNLSTCVE